MRTQNVPFSVTLLAALTSMTVAEQTLSGKITGYGAASNDPPGATICCGLQGSEHSATYDDPGTAAADNNKFPTGTKIYVPVCVSNPQITQKLHSITIRTLTRFSLYRVYKNTL